MDTKFQLGSSAVTYPAWDGHGLTLFNDAATGPDGGGAFDAMAQAIDDARHLVFIMDWSFHPEARLRPTSNDCIGNVLIRKARKFRETDLLIAIHTWNHTVKASTDIENDFGQETLEFMSRPHPMPANLLWRMSSRTGQNRGEGFGWSHHQKFLLVDGIAPDGRSELVVFFGGLDITKGRFDWPSHDNRPDQPQVAKLLQEFEYRGKRKYDDWYNLEFGGLDRKQRVQLPRQTWHDVHARMTGPAAWDFAREFAGRWLAHAGDGQSPERWAATKKLIVKRFMRLFDSSVFVQQGEPPPQPKDPPSKAPPDRRPWTAQVVRSILRDHWGSFESVRTPTGSGTLQDEFRWKLTGKTYEASIQEAYVKWIKQAERFIYIETQYFIGSGTLWGRNSVTNRIPELLIQKIAGFASQKKPFHVYIIFPAFPEGAPDGMDTSTVRHLQWLTIEAMLKAIQELPYGESKVGGHWIDYISFYFLAQWRDKGSLAPAGRSRFDRVVWGERYPIYVHTKMMICDDHHLILGSCNLNERGLSGGRDTEICVALSPSSDRYRKECIAQVQDLRRRLWTEHLTHPGKEREALANIPWETPEMTTCSFAVQEAAAANYRNFVGATKRAVSGHLCRWPISIDRQSGRLTWGSIGSARTAARLREELEHALVPDYGPINPRMGNLVIDVLESAWAAGPTAGHPAAVNTDLPE